MAAHVELILPRLPLGTCRLSLLMCMQKSNRAEHSRSRNTCFRRKTSAAVQIPLIISFRSHGMYRAHADSDEELWEDV